MPTEPEADSAAPEGRPGLAEMSFFGHLEELRKRIVWALLGLIAGSIVAGIYVREIVDWILLKPAVSVNLELQNLRPFGQTFLFFKVILVGGAIISLPFTLYQIWKFVAPGLHEHERHWAGKITGFTTLCFLAGVAFAYWIMIPTMLDFTVKMGTSFIKNSIDITEYFGFITTTILSAGLIFELPMISYVLTRVGILTPKWLAKYRRHSLVAILVLAAVLTPSTDPVSQLLFAVPMWVLYEISIIISKFAVKKKAETPT